MSLDWVAPPDDSLVLLFLSCTQRRSLDFLAIWLDVRNRYSSIYEALSKQQLLVYTHLT
jgi:hypothetical protein